MPHNFSPLFIIEGLAVWMESRYYNEGRANDPFFWQYFYTLLSKENFISLSSIAALYHRFPYYTAPYLFGSIIMTKLGEQKIKKYIKRYSARLAVPLTIDYALKEERGWNNFYKKIVEEEVLKAQPPFENAKPVVEVKGFIVDATTDGKNIYFVWTKPFEPSFKEVVPDLWRLEMVTPEGKRKLIRQGVVIRNLKYKNGLWWMETELKPALNSLNADFYIKIMRKTKKGIKEIVSLKNARCFGFVKGQLWYAVQDGMTDKVFRYIISKRKSVLIGAFPMRFAEFFSYKKEIYAIAKKEGEFWCLYKFNQKSNSWKKILYKNGWICDPFVAGEDVVYSFREKREARIGKGIRKTQYLQGVRFGIYPMKIENKIYFVSYHPKGMGIYCKEENWKKISFDSPQTYPPPPSVSFKKLSWKEEIWFWGRYLLDCPLRLPLAFYDQGTWLFGAAFFGISRDSRLWYIAIPVFPYSSLSYFSLHATPLPIFSVQAQYFNSTTELFFDLTLHRSIRNVLREIYIFANAEFSPQSNFAGAGPFVTLIMGNTYVNTGVLISEFPSFKLNSKLLYFSRVLPYFKADVSKQINIEGGLHLRLLELNFGLWNPNIFLHAVFLKPWASLSIDSLLNYSLGIDITVGTTLLYLLRLPLTLKIVYNSKTGLSVFFSL